MKTTTTVLLLSALLFGPACGHHDECAEGTTRCRGASAEICDAGGRWTAFLDCDEVSAQSDEAFACCVADPAAGPDVTCLPVATCEASGDR
jgi:hypothetical protein